MGIIYVGTDFFFFSHEIQGGLGPGVCCPKTIVQATSKMKAVQNWFFFDCFDAQLSRKGSAGFRFAASQVLLYIICFAAFHIEIRRISCF